MNPALELLYIIIKNLKVVFRSWTTLMLIVIGPLILIGIIGFAFSGQGLNDIRLGIYSPDKTQIADIVDVLQSEGVSLYYYDDTDICKEDIKKEAMHVCAEFSEDFLVSKGEKEVEFSTGDITFYYDNSKINLVTAVVGFVKEKVAITSEQITLESTKTILANIEDSVVFMVGAQQQIENFTVQANESKKELIEFRDTLITINENFEGPYSDIKNVQEDFNQRADELESARAELYTNTDAMFVSLDEMYAETLRLEEIANPQVNISLNVTNETLNISLAPVLNLSSTRAQITVAKTQLTTITDSVDKNSGDIEELREQLNELVIYLDSINHTLNKDIEKLDRNIENLDRAVLQLQAMSSVLGEKIHKFSGVSQEQANALLQPIRSFFSSLLGEQSKVYLIFPVLLAFIIMFISILLSNMIVLNETHSEAYFRNFLIPISNIYFTLGLFFTSLIIALFQVLIFLWVGYSRFGVDITTGFWDLFVVCAMSISVFVLVGMIIGYWIKSEQTSILISTFTALAVFLFSDVIFPIESMPKIAAYFARFNPLVVSESMFRKILFYNLDLSTMGPQILILGVLIIALLLIAVVLGFTRKD